MWRPIKSQSWGWGPYWWGVALDLPHKSLFCGTFDFGSPVEGTPLLGQKPVNTEPSDVAWAFWQSSGDLGPLSEANHSATRPLSEAYHPCIILQWLLSEAYHHCIILQWPLSEAYHICIIQNRAFVWRLSSLHHPAVGLFFEDLPSMHHPVEGLCLRVLP